SLLERLAGVELYDVRVPLYCFPNAGLINNQLSSLFGLNGHLLESIASLAITNSVDEAETTLCDQGLNLVGFTTYLKFVTDQLLAFNHFFQNIKKYEE
ncbi:MAG: hypothetical protein ACKO96_40555, partial [Flammeovirgaceae bacterium]